MITDLAISWHGHQHRHLPTESATWLGGSFPQWLTLIATAGALGWAVFLYRRSVADKRKEQPRLVYALPIGQPDYFDVDRVMRAVNRANVRTDLPRLNFPPRRDIAGVDFRAFEDGGQKMHQALKPGALLKLIIVNDSTEVISDVYAGVGLTTTLDYQVGRFRAADYLAPGDRIYREVRWTTPVHSPEQAPLVFPWVEFTDGTGGLWATRTGYPLVHGKERGRRTIRRDLHRLGSALADVGQGGLSYLRWRK